ncbi:valine-tRNA ligase Vrs2/Vas2 [Schizosaccharomyces cryophilus OY26]|uniref:valine--tRNA ligase n=1 Tax=Schizosaccharomyces cryophilus (strain OY26 / ATCC MYA-4695 / CBS 11777 / NBRC 106824 / NRRL Y48691) TaxID=653667 RepID=S9VXU2_SCHCR|nr:valine-tRNA ligase Vrs2/Vas2 [Schizosaccharomyces cryophilus OY26]EPY52398.1 valine-tRNA ligase Vrs2/Vas2 [Schizosaccharomyces cryophilus OY26]
MHLHSFFHVHPKFFGLYKPYQFVRCLNLQSSYQPAHVEAVWHELQQGLSSVEHPPSKANINSDTHPFPILLPPPNITGKLHIGHALTITIQDALARYYSMNGCQVSFRPGTDHAGIATQSAVEKFLNKKGITKANLTESEFMLQVRDWEHQFQHRIRKQLEAFGALFDWENGFYTLDQERSHAVSKAFVDLFDSGYIYRANRFVNWCPKLTSAISEMEVESQLISDPVTKRINGVSVDFGYMYQIAYPLLDSSNESIVVSTTRPETVFGDRAIAVNPHDSKYQRFIGKFARHPLRPDLVLPIVADDTVDPTFYTGALKITPSHSSVDFDIAKRHEIPLAPILDLKGRLVNCSNELNGMDRLCARPKIVQMLKNVGALVNQLFHSCVLSVCSRTGDVIEPIMVPQWYLSVDHLRKELLHMTEEQNLKFFPPSTKSDWYRWLENMQDWCLSRQIAWGHRIPVWKYETTNGEQWVAAETQEKAIKKSNGALVTQDSDVLDTWFSSSLLPLSAFGWPRLKNVPILPFIESGKDIIFFWIARMALMCSYFTKALPFREVILHPLIRDSEGRKMSKSLGNVIDPMDIIHGVSFDKLEAKLLEGSFSKSEMLKSLAHLKKSFPKGIRAQGLDALRFGLCLSLHHNQRILLDMESFSNSYRFLSKLWNLVRYFGQYESVSVNNGNQATLNESFKIIKDAFDHRLQLTVECCRENFDNRSLFKVAESLEKFLLNDLSVEFVDLTRPLLKNPDTRDNVLQFFHHLMNKFLRLTHPVIPCLTEVLWKHLDYKPKGPLHKGIYPSAEERKVVSEKAAQANEVVKDIMKIIYYLRSLKVNRKPSNDQELPVYILSSTGSLGKFCETIKYLTGYQVNMLLENDLQNSTSTFVQFMVSRDTVLMVPSNFMHRNLPKLEKNIDELRKKVEKLDFITASAGYVKAPASIKTRNKQHREELLAMINSLRDKINRQ